MKTFDSCSQNKKLRFLCSLACDMFFAGWHKTIISQTKKQPTKQKKPYCLTKRKIIRLKIQEREINRKSAKKKPLLVSALVISCILAWIDSRRLDGLLINGILIKSIVIAFVRCASQRSHWADYRKTQAFIKGHSR